MNSKEARGQDFSMLENIVEHVFKKNRVQRIKVDGDELHGSLEIFVDNARGNSFEGFAYKRDFEQNKHNLPENVCKSFIELFKMFSNNGMVMSKMDASILLCHVKDNDNHDVSFKIKGEAHKDEDVAIKDPNTSVIDKLKNLFTKKSSTERIVLGYLNRVVKK